MLTALVETEGRQELADELAGCLTNRGLAFRDLGKLPEAIQDYNKAIAIQTRLVETDAGRNWVVARHEPDQPRRRPGHESQDVPKPLPILTGLSPSTPVWWRRRAGRNWPMSLPTAWATAAAPCALTTACRKRSRLSTRPSPSSADWSNRRGTRNWPSGWPGV